MTLIELERCKKCPYRNPSEDAAIFCEAFKNWDELNPNRIPHEVIQCGSIFVTCPVEIFGGCDPSDEARARMNAILHVGIY